MARLRSFASFDLRAGIVGLANVYNVGWLNFYFFLRGESPGKELRRLYVKI